MILKDIEKTEEITDYPTTLGQHNFIKSFMFTKTLRATIGQVGIKRLLSGFSKCSSIGIII